MKKGGRSTSSVKSAGRFKSIDRSFPGHEERLRPTEAADEHEDLKSDHALASRFEIEAQTNGFVDADAMPNRHASCNGPVHSNQMEDKQQAHDVEMLLTAEVEHGAGQVAPQPSTTTYNLSPEHHPKRQRRGICQDTSSSPLAHNSHGTTNASLSAQNYQVHVPRSRVQRATPAPAAPSFNQTRRFAPATTTNFSPAQPYSPSPVSIANAARPRFVAPAPSDLASPTPLPDAFSPYKHRRGQERYIVGGWANQVRGWIFDAAGADAATAPTHIMHIEAAQTVQGSAGQGAMAVATGLITSDGDIDEYDCDRRSQVLLVGEGSANDGGGRGFGHGHSMLETSDSDAPKIDNGARVRLGPPTWIMELPRAERDMLQNETRPSAHVTKSQNTSIRRSDDGTNMELRTVSAGWTVLS